MEISQVVDHLVIQFCLTIEIYVITNKQKNVSKQIAENNNVCIVAYDNENWIRINCQLIDDSKII